MRSCFGDGDEHVNNLWIGICNIRQEVSYVGIHFVSTDDVINRQYAGYGVRRET